MDHSKKKGELREYKLYSGGKFGSSLWRITLIFGVAPSPSRHQITTSPRHHVTTSPRHHVTTSPPRHGDAIKKSGPYLTNFRERVVSFRVGVPPPLQSKPSNFELDPRWSSSALRRGSSLTPGLIPPVAPLNEPRPE